MTCSPDAATGREPLCMHRYPVVHHSNRARNRTVTVKGSASEAGPSRLDGVSNRQSKN
jgi:hypothetical protein